MILMLNLILFIDRIIASPSFQEVVLFWDKNHFKLNVHILYMASCKYINLNYQVSYIWN